MEVTEKGLRFKPVLTEQGAGDVHDGWDEFSPYWLLNKAGEEGGATIARPFLLKSIGLVPRGNIPGLSLVNAASDDGELLSSQSHMNKHVIKLLAAMGISVAADANDETIAQAVDSACPTIAAANAAVPQLATLKTAKETLDGKVIALETDKAKLEGEKLALANSVKTAEDLFKAERKERSMLLVNAAVTEGRVPAAERDSTVLALVNSADFTAEADKLAKRQKGLVTTSRATRLGEDRASDGSVLALVNVRMKESSEDYETAYAAVQQDPKNAALFKKMKTPEIKFRRR
jgi:Mu-like prophage I protein